MMKNIITLFIGVFLLSGVNPGYGEDLREDKNYPVGDIKAYAPYDWGHHPDVITSKNKRGSSHLTDQHVWVYTKEFAERFGMPSRWIGGKDFKGALALAYRQELRNDIWCGYFGNLDNCRQLSNYCVLDVYVSHDSQTIPWNTDKQAGRFYSAGAHSIRFLKFFRNSQYERDKYKDEEGNLPNWYYEGPEGETDFQNLIPGGKNVNAGIDSVSTAYRFGRDGFGESGGSPWVREFHRNVLVGIDLITIQGLCNFAKTGDGDAQIRFDEGHESYKNRKKTKKDLEAERYNKNLGDKYFFHKDLKLPHKIYPGLDFMQRVKVYTEENAGSSFFEFFQKNIHKGKK